MDVDVPRDERRRTSGGRSPARRCAGSSPSPGRTERKLAWFLVLSVRHARCSPSPRRCSPGGSSTRSSTAPTTSVVVRLAAADRADRRRRGRARRCSPAGCRRRIGEGLILDLRTRGVRPRAADADRVLHPHPHRRAGQPAQQRRDRRPAGLQRHPVRRGQQRRHAGADPRRDAQHVLADHPARAGAAAGVRAPGPPDGQPAGRPASARPPTTTRR